MEQQKERLHPLPEMKPQKQKNRTQQNNRQVAFCQQAQDAGSHSPRFYNTINAHGDDLLHHRKKTQTQQELILHFFKENPYSQYTPFEVQSLIKLRTGRNFNINSVRRSITNLTQSGNLVKTNKRVMEREGMTNFTWRLNNAPPKQLGLL